MRRNKISGNVTVTVTDKKVVLHPRSRSGNLGQTGHLKLSSPQHI